MRRPLAIAASAAVLVLTVVSTRASEKRFITESDLLTFTWMADPQMSGNLESGIRYF